MTPVLVVDEVSHGYADAAAPAVDAVSLQVAPGETLGLVGPSGSGKSTLARLIMALERPARGRILIEGTDLAMLRPAALRALRRRWSMVFQDPGAAFNPRTTVGEAVAVPLRVHAPGPARAQRAAVETLLGRVQLDPELAGRPIHTLSGGQQQRVALARALATRPVLIVLDEAVSALDTVVRGGILNLLVDLQRSEGLAMLFISHDLAVVRTVSHRIAVMDGGRLVETGPAEAVIAAPRSSTAQALVAAVPRLPEGANDEPA